MTVHASIEGLFWIVVVVVSVIAQLVKASKEKQQKQAASPSRPEPGGERRVAPSKSVDEDLREFFNRLGGGAADEAPSRPTTPARPAARERPVPPPVPPPPAARVKATPRRGPAPRIPVPDSRTVPFPRRESRQRVQAAGARQVATAPPIPFRPAAPVTGVQASYGDAAYPRRSVAARVRTGQAMQPVDALSLHRRVRAELRDPDAVRRAVLLREILGPPAALRRGGASPAEAR